MAEKVDTPESLLLELAQHLQHDAELNAGRFGDRRVGSLCLSLEDGALWKRIVLCIGGEPDLTRDVVIPAIMKRVEPAEPVRNESLVDRHMTP